MKHRVYSAPDGRNGTSKSLPEPPSRPLPYRRTRPETVTGRPACTIHLSYDDQRGNGTPDAKIRPSQKLLSVRRGESNKLAASQPQLEHIMSIESDRAFIQQRKPPDEAIASGVTSHRLRFEHADIGPTRKWGRPVNQSSIAKRPNYSGAVFATDRAWDLVLVDGIFRVACVAAALLQSPKTRVLVHDFWRRKRYRPLLDYCDVIETANQLVLLGRGADATDDALTRLLRKHDKMPTDHNAWQKFVAKLGIKS